MPNDLTVIDKADQLTTALQSYKPENYNLLLPTTNPRFIAKDHRIVINTVRLEPDDDFWPVDQRWVKRGGQWHSKVEGYALSKRGLRRLMHISGASITESQTRYDEEGRVHAKAVVQMTMADGLTRQFIGNYTWDTPARIEEAEQRYQEKVKREPTKKAKHRKAFEADRHRIIKFATSLAESGAINRCLRDALTTKNSYAPEEIQKPFVCLQVVEPRRPEIDFDHPAIQKLMSMAMMNTGQLPQELYEPQQTPQLTQEYVDPTSDAVAAGEVEVEEREPKEDFGNGQPPISEDIEVPPEPSESPDPRDWDDRPLEPEELRRRMNLQPGEDKPVTQRLFEKYHAAMGTLTGSDDDKRHPIQNYFYSVESSRELHPWQLGRLYLWVGTKKEIIQEANEEKKEISEWVPNPHAAKEMSAVVRAHQKEAGQLDLFDEEKA